MQSEEMLPSCVEVGHAAFELLSSQEHGATCVKYGIAATLLLTLVFIVNKQLSPVWKNHHGISLYTSLRFKQLLSICQSLFIFHWIVVLDFICRATGVTVNVHFVFICN